MKAINATLDVSISLMRHMVDNTALIELKITDRTSRQPVTMIEFTPDEFMRMLAGQYLGSVDGWVTPPEFRHRIGKRVEVTEIEVPVAIIGKYAPKTPALEAFAEDERRHGIYEDIDVFHTNHGWVLIGRRWVDVGPQATDGEGEEHRSE